MVWKTASLFKPIFSKHDNPECRKNFRKIAVYLHMHLHIQKCQQTYLYTKICNESSHHCYIWLIRLLTPMTTFTYDKCLAKVWKLNNSQSNMYWVLTAQFKQVTCSNGRTSQHSGCGSSKDTLPLKRRHICSAVSSDRKQWSQALYPQAAFQANWELTNGRSTKMISPAAKSFVANSPLP